MMSSGRRESVLLFSPSMIAELYMKSIEHYGPDQIFVLIGNSKDRMTEIINSRYRESMRSAGYGNITEYEVDVYNFEEILGKIIEIKSNLRSRFKDDLDLYINISSGTHEFAAAGMFASMLPNRAIPFRVGVTDGISDEFIKNASELRPEVSDPMRIANMQNSEPDDEMIVFLSILDGMFSRTKYPKHSEIIERLKKMGAWTYDPERKSSNKRTSIENKEEMYLRRHYIIPALDNGWLCKPTKSSMAMTDAGRTYLSVYGRSMQDERLEYSMIMLPYSEEYDTDYESADDDDPVILKFGGKEHKFWMRMQ